MSNQHLSQVHPGPPEVILINILIPERIKKSKIILTNGFCLLLVIAGRFAGFSGTILSCACLFLSLLALSFDRKLTRIDQILCSSHMAGPNVAAVNTAMIVAR